MHRPGGAALLLGAFACTQPSRPAGELRTMADLADAARLGNPDGKAAVALRGQPLTFLSNPYSSGTQVQEAGGDGLEVQPAFADAHPAAFVTTEIWDGFPRVWAQPLYLLVTRFDPQRGSRPVAGALPRRGPATGTRLRRPSPSARPA